MARVNQKILVAPYARSTRLGIAVGVAIASWGAIETHLRAVDVAAFLMGILIGFVVMRRQIFTYDPAVVPPLQSDGCVEPVTRTLLRVLLSASPLFVGVAVGIRWPTIGSAFGGVAVGFILRLAPSSWRISRLDRAFSGRLVYEAASAPPRWRRTQPGLFLAGDSNACDHAISDTR